MTLTVWAWDDAGPRCGVSDAGPTQVLDVTTLDPTWQSISALCRHLFDMGDGPAVSWLTGLMRDHSERIDVSKKSLIFPVSVSEVWAAGVTYERSRVARLEETQGADQFYSRVYSAVRPEIFFKAMGERLAAPGAAMGLRRDAHWIVPEPELAIVLNPRGEIFGFTVANDLSARDIEGENPLYLPQAKIFHRSAALGPSLALGATLNPSGLDIRLEVVRHGRRVFDETVNTDKMRRPVEELVSYLRREWEVLPWTVLMTGTGIVPPSDFALEDGDEMAITISEIGTLRNVARRISPDWANVPA